MRNTCRARQQCSNNFLLPPPSPEPYPPPPPMPLSPTICTREQAQFICGSLPCYYDPNCSVSIDIYGGLGCKAAGIDWNCRFCGFGIYDMISCPGNFPPPPPRALNPPPPHPPPLQYVVINNDYPPTVYFGIVLLYTSSLQAYRIWRLLRRKNKK